MDRRAFLRQSLGAAATAAFFPRTALAAPSPQPPALRGFDPIPPNPYAPAYRPELYSKDSLLNIPVPRGGSEIDTYQGQTIVSPNCLDYSIGAYGFGEPGASLKDRKNILPDEGLATSRSLVDLRKAVRHDIVGNTLDGLTFVGQEPRVDPNTYLIAYYRLLPQAHMTGDGGAGDYHYVRQNQDGTWSQKPGATAVTNKDSSGKIITDPRTADIRINDGRRYMFIGFFQAPSSLHGHQSVDNPLPGTGWDKITPFNDHALQNQFYKIAMFQRPSDGYARFLQHDGKNWMSITSYARPTSMDDEGHIITDPSKTHMKGYDFKGYFSVPDWNPKLLPAWLQTADLKNYKGFKPAGLQP